MSRRRCARCSPRWIRRPGNRPNRPPPRANAAPGRANDLTTTPTGKLTFHVFAALAEFEAELGRERTRAGLAAARRRGKTLGRPRSLDAEQIEMARTAMASPRLSARQVAEQLGVHRSTLYRSLAAR